MPGDTPRLRNATDADRDLCFDIKKRAFGDYIDEIWGWQEGLQRTLHDREFDPSEYQIVKVGDRDVGVLGVREEDECLWVGKIYILPMYQNRGHGTRLIRDVIARADDAGKPVRLQVLKINPARKLYERLGFRVTGTNGPHHVMERPVSPSAKRRSEKGA